jgi:hypothetical protein
MLSEKFKLSDGDHCPARELSLLSQAERLAFQLKLKLEGQIVQNKWSLQISLVVYNVLTLF